MRRARQGWLFATALAVAPLAAVLGVVSPAAAFAWPNATERAEHLLTRGSVAQRRSAVATLDRLPRAAARRLLLVALADPEVEVRLAAVRLAPRLDAPGVGERVSAWLEDPEVSLRLAALQYLARAPRGISVSVVGRSLADPDEGVRVAAAAALGASGSPDAVLPLTGRSEDTSALVRRAVCDALGRLGDPRAVIALGGRTGDGATEVRVAAVRALGRVGDPRAVGQLVLALRDREVEVRRATLVALGRVRAVDAVAAMAPIARDAPELELRYAALRALGRISGDAAIEALVRALAADTTAAAPAATALAALGADAVPRLTRCLERGEDVARGCALALASAQGHAALPVLLRARARGLVDDGAWLDCLERAGTRDETSEALALLRHGDERVRRRAVVVTRALLDPAHPDGGAVDPVSDALGKARSLDERVALLQLLGATRAERASPLLAEVAAHAQSAELRIAALSALGEIASPGYDATFERALGAAHRGVRWAAGTALFRAAGPGSARRWLSLADRSARRDRPLVLLAVGGALARGASEGDIAEVAAHLSGADGPSRDALFEALGRAPGAAAGAVLARELARQPPEDRAKIAEALAQHPERAEALLGALRDPDARVRANAAWSVGSWGKAEYAATLARLLVDPSSVVAANAAIAVGRSAPPASAARALCTALDDPRDAVRGAAARGLALARSRCEAHRDRARLGEERSPSVRVELAHWLRAAADGDGDDDRRVLARCADDDPDSTVAVACGEEPAGRAATGTEPVLVYVAPDGEPAPGVTFALVQGGGLVRRGSSDRRGAVFEAAAPRGELSLAPVD